MPNKEQSKPAQKPDPENCEQVLDTPDEMALDAANALSFPASDPVSVSNITRIEKAPETAPASKDHQNSNTVGKTGAGGKSRD
ncbi:MAG: hypothetical protein JWP38_819 [Herbaspirillum sp.]|nr:hypothetical protein [Herbaspirillum sp.]